jgi:hypothetical protein
MASKTFKLTNYSSSPAEIDSISFTNPSGILHKANLNQFGGHLTGRTEYTESSGANVIQTGYITDTRPQTAQFQSYLDKQEYTGNFVSYNTVTNALTLANLSGTIGSGWAITGAGFNDNQSVVSVSTNTVIVSADPDLPILPNSLIKFTSPVFIRQLTVTPKNNRIQPNWVVSSEGSGFTEDQTVVRIIPSGSNTTIVEISASQDSPLNLGQEITFTSPGDVKELYVTDLGGIIAGYTVSGNGYDGQTVVSILNNPDRLQMSDHPSGNPVYPGTLKFTDTRPIAVLPANSTIEFTIDYTQTLNTPTNVNAQMVISGSLAGLPVVKTLNNSIAISQAPKVDPNTNFNPSGGAGQTAPPPAPAPPRRSRWWKWVPVVVLITTGVLV